MPYSTWDSLVVPYQSTDQAQRCLTSQFGWDAVLSPWYDRMTRALRKSCTSLFIFWKNKNSNFFNFYFFNFLFFSNFYFFKKIRVFIFSAFRGPGHCGPFISYIKHQIPNVRLWLPKFDSKILISWEAFRSHLRPPGYRTPGHGRKIEKIKSNEKIKIKSRKNKKSKSLFLFLFF